MGHKFCITNLLLESVDIMYNVNGRYGMRIFGTYCLEIIIETIHFVYYSNSILNKLGKINWHHISNS